LLNVSVGAAVGFEDGFELGFEDGLLLGDADGAALEPKLGLLLGLPGLALGSLPQITFGAGL
jgi:hypothetical protein